MFRIRRFMLFLCRKYYLLEKKMKESVLRQDNTFSTEETLLSGKITIFPWRSKWRILMKKLTN